MSKDIMLTDQVYHISELFFRRLQQQLTEPERQELDSWIAEQSPESKTFFLEMTDREQIRTALHLLYQVDVDPAWAEVQQKIRLEEETAIVAPMRRRFWNVPFKYAAAVLLLAGLGGGYFVLRRPKQADVTGAVEPRFKNDVSPGGQKALLELADGKRIVLDSAANGVLAHQGGMQVVKPDDGQLSYQETTNRPQEDNALTFNTVITPRGGQYQVVLPDGSKVWLNAASSLRFPTRFSGGRRLVVLTGEAFFEVAKNSAMPFTVEVDQGRPMELEVLGTRFNIEAYTDEQTTRTTLIDGSVKVSAKQQQRLLKPGEQAEWGGDGGGALKVSDVNTDEVVAWKDGLFVFRDASLPSIMRQVARWYDVDIVYEGKAPRQLVGKIPRSVNLSTLLKILESTGSVHFMINGKKITVVSE